MIADPLQLYDCCPFSDGAAAVVLAPLDRARDLVRRPVRITGMGQASAGPLYTQPDLTRVLAREESARQVYQQAGRTPRDIDVCELHDCFTIAQIVATEGLGFFEFGKGSKAAAEGKTGLEGIIPINPSGGLKARGHPIGATGAAQVYEIVKQLRDEAGPRQVAGARVGMTDTLGGDLMTCCNMILEA
jgi:acetyl-CoA C-acetyltransferase/acetyl-CoA acyltransferase